MKNIRNVVLIIVAVVMASCGGNKNKVATSGSLMWKVEKEGLPGASYLYGTIHLMPEADFFIAEDLKVALASTKALVLEADMDMGIKEQLALAKYMVLPSGKDYSDYMEMVDYNALRAYLRDTIGMKEGKMDRYMKMKPFFLMSALLMEAYDDVAMYEIELATLAKKNDLPILELEGVEYQMELIDSIGLSMSFPTIDDLNLVPEYEKLLSAYLSKDLDKLYELMMADMDPNSEEDMLVEKYLFQRRNAEWVPKVENLVAEQPVFIAVGAGHLAGETGLVASLKKQGYTLTPMEY